MFKKLKDIWNDKGFEIVFGICLAFIIIFGLYNIITNKKGSWSKNIILEEKKNNYIKNNNDIKQSINPKDNKDSKGETECRRVLEKFFDRPFSKARPNFLNNVVTGGTHNLELDCFNEELRIAVEYDGIQHTKYIPFFHKNKEHFLNQKYRDELKNMICKQNRILLIRVPYTIKIENIEKYLLNELNKYFSK
jgi:hypothetical protein